MIAPPYPISSSGFQGPPILDLLSQEQNNARLRIKRVSLNQHKNTNHTCDQQKPHDMGHDTAKANNETELVHLGQISRPTPDFIQPNSRISKKNISSTSKEK